MAQNQNQMPLRYFLQKQSGQPDIFYAGASPNVPYRTKEFSLQEAQQYLKQNKIYQDQEALNREYQSASSEFKRRVAADEIPSGNFDSAGFYSGKTILTGLGGTKATLEQILSGNLPQSGMLAQGSAPGTSFVPVAQEQQYQEMKAKEAQGLVKNIGSEKAPLWIPVGSAGDLLKTDPKAYAEKDGGAGVPGYDTPGTYQTTAPGGAPGTPGGATAGVSGQGGLNTGVFQNPATGKYSKIINGKEVETDKDGNPISGPYGLPAGAVLLGNEQGGQYGQSSYTGPSVVDYLKSVNQPSDYASRAKMAQQLGIQNYTGTAEQNTQMLNTLRGQSSNGIAATSDPATNAKKEAELEEEERKAKEAQDSADEEEKLEREKRIRELREELGLDPDTGEKLEKPPLPDYENEYEAMRSEAGLDALESQINKNKKLLRDMEESLTQGLYDEEGRLRPMGLITTRQKELQEQARRKMNEITRANQTLVDEYNTKLSMIQMTMQYSQQDYANAVQDYQLKFNQSLQMYNMIKSEETAEQKVAAANLTTLTNYITTAIQSGKLTAETIPQDMRNMITKLELQTDSIPGITMALMNITEPTKNKLATITSPDKSTVSVLYDDGTVQTFNTGVNTKNEKIPRNEEIKNTIDQSLQDSNLIGTDKKVAWETYRDMLITWVNNNGTESEFYINYPITTWLDEGNKTEFSTWLSGNQKSSIKSGEDAPLFPEEDND